MDSALYPRPSAANAANRSGTAQVCCGMATAVDKIDQGMEGAHPMPTDSIVSSASDLKHTACGLLQHGAPPTS